MRANDMLRSEVAMRLAMEGAPADAEAVSTVINQIREDAVGLLGAFALSLVGCTKADCNCSVAALVYHSLARELREAA